MEKIFSHLNRRSSVLAFVITCIVFASGIFGAWSTVFAAAPARTLGFQGQLFNSGTAVDSSVSATFKFYDALSGGSQAGSAVSKTVAVDNGYFSTSFDESDLSGIDWSQGLWIEVSIEGNILTPRSAINAVPFAERAFGTFSYSAAPTVGPAGSLYYNSATGALLVSNGSAWTSVGSSGSATTTLSVGNGFLHTATSTDGVKAAYFVATSTTATSTFAGNVYLDNGQAGPGTTGSILSFSNSYDTAAVNKIRLFNDTNWVAGFGIQQNAMALHSGGDYSFYTGTTQASIGTVRMTILSAGNVGIGTTSPTQKLVSVGDGTYYALMLDNSASDSSTNKWRITPTGSAWGAGDNKLVFTYEDTISANSKFTIDGTTGNVGISSSTPSARLSVTGSGTGTGRAFVIADSNNVPRFTVLDNGNLGFGSTTPGSTLSGPLASAFSIAASSPVQASASVAGNALTIRASDATRGSASGTAGGGAVSITAGSGINFSSSGTGNGGAITLTAGNAAGLLSSDWPAGGDGGAISLTAGAAGANNGSVGGSVTLTAGLAGVNSSVTGGITLKTPDASQTKGDILLLSGSNVSVSNTGNAGGGAIKLTTGSGHANYAAANGQASNGGLLALTLGNGGTTSGDAISQIGGTGGAFNIVGGTGGTAVSVGGSNTGGNGSAFTFTTGAGGNATGASGTRTGGNSGNLVLRIGAPGTGATANGVYGNIQIAPTGGGVVIGTSTPWAKLAIQQAPGATIPLFDIATTTSATFATSSLFTVLSNGNVGIGTTNPIYKLAIGGSPSAGVQASLPAASFAASYITGGASTGAILVVEDQRTTSSGNGAFVGLYANDGAAMSSGDRLGGFFFGGYDGNATNRNSAGVFAFADGTWSATSIPTYFTFETAPSGSVTRVERLRITSGGNIGIGSTTPGAKLTVKGDGTTTGANFQTTNSSNEPLFTVLDSGFVGIGTANPVGQLNIVGDSTATSALFIDRYGSASAAGMITRAARGTEAAPSATQANDGLLFFGARGYGTSQFSASSIGAILINAEAAFTNTSNPTYISFQTTPSSSVTRAEVMRITSAGNVGIGTTTPNSRLDVGGLIASSPINGFAPIANISSSTNAIAGMEMRNASNGTGAEFRFAVSDNTATNYLAFTMPSSGNTSTLFGQTRSNIAALFSASNNGTGRILALGTVDSKDVILGTQNLERFRILGSNGNVGIGQTAPAVALHIGSTTIANATSLLRLQDADSACNFNANDGTGSCASDATLKKNIASTDNNLDKILALRPVSYNWNTDADGTEAKIGFIAQEVGIVMPELVQESTWIDGTARKFLSTGGMMPYLVGAIKEQQLQLDELMDDLETYAIFIRTKELHTEKLCVGTEDDEVCVTKEEFRNMLQNSKSVPAPSISPSPMPETAREENPTNSEAADPVDPTPIDDGAPSPTPTPDTASPELEQATPAPESEQPSASLPEPISASPPPEPSPAPASVSE